MAEVPPFLWADAGTFDAPKEYTVPGSGEVQPYTATATYANNSGQAILPALRIKSDSGNLLALVFPAGQIADGDTSEVTFVPPFGSAASDSTGIRYDVNNVGDWLAVSTTGVFPTGVDGIKFYTGNGGQFEVETTGGFVVNNDTGQLLLNNQDTGNQLIVLSSGGLAIEDQSAGILSITSSGGGDIDVTTNSGGTQRYQSGDGFIWLSVHTGGGENVFLFNLSQNDALSVKDHNGNTILLVEENGPAYHIKTGKAWVADL